MKLVVALFLGGALAAAQTIKVDIAKRVSFGEVHEVVAKVIEAPKETQLLYAPVEGHVEKILVLPGQPVQKGDVVMLISSKEVVQKLARTKEVKKRLAITKKRLKRAKKLLERGLVSAKEYENLQIELAKLESKKRELDAFFANLKAPLYKNGYKVVAHQSGVVEKIFVKVHSQVESGDPLIGFAAPKRLLKAFVPVEFAGKKPLQARFCLLECNQVYYLQTLSWVDEETALAQMLFEGVQESLLGAFGKLYLRFANDRKLFVLPKAAITKFEGEWVVFVVDEDGDYIPKVVKIVAFLGDKVAVDGLREGDRFVAQGVYYVKSHLLRSSLGEHGH